MMTKNGVVRLVCVLFGLFFLFLVFLMLKGRETAITVVIYYAMIMFALLSITYLIMGFTGHGIDDKKEQNLQW
jgi:hypothetical protein